MTFWKLVGAVVFGAAVTASLAVLALTIVGYIVETCTKVPTPY